jgi:ubiquinone/menaquinone biosynthesis C-methylase UbiE
MATPHGAEATGDSQERLAAAWERHRKGVFERHRRVSEWLVDQVDPRPGHLILELAAGPGETGFLAAERIGPEGKLISTDIVPRMVEAARRGAEARGLANVETRVMDAQEIDLPDAAVDGVLCRFGLMVMPQPDRALSEVRRVLRSGGRLAYAVFGPPEKNPWMTLLVRAVGEVGHQLPGDLLGPGGQFFSLATAERNRTLLHKAGFSDVTVEELADVRRYDDFDAYWDLHSQITGPVALLISSLSADEAETLRAALKPMLAPFQIGTGYEIPSLVVMVAAR